MAMLCELIDIEKEMISIFNGDSIAADVNEDARMIWDNRDSIDINGNIINDACTSGKRGERDY